MHILSQLRAITRKFLLALFVLPILLCACSKSDSGGSSANTFTIDGITDVNMGTATGNMLAIAVRTGTGVQETVNLSVTDLPTGIDATIEPASGIPNFASLISFKRTAASMLTPAGTYPIHIKGNSSTYSKIYDLKLILNEYNAFVVNGTSYAVSQFEKYNFGYDQIRATSTDGSSLMFFFANGATLPTADGTYTYYLYSNTSAPDKYVGVSFTPAGNGGNGFINTGTDMHTLTVTVSAGKYTLSFPDTEFKNGSQTKTISARVKQ